MTKRVTCDEALQALATMRLSETAEFIAAALGVDSRAVVNALRAAVKDGRVTVAIKGDVFRYRLVKREADL